MYAGKSCNCYKWLLSMTKNLKNGWRVKKKKEKNKTKRERPPCSPTWLKRKIKNKNGSNVKAVRHVVARCCQGSLLDDPKPETITQNC